MNGPATLAGEVARAVATVQKLGIERPELATPAGALARALPVIFRDVEGPNAVSTERVRDQARADVPFFQADPPELDAARLRRTARALAWALKRDLRSAAGFAKVDIAAWANAWVRGEVGPLEADAERRGLDPVEALTLLRLTVWPELAARTDHLDGLRLEHDWKSKTCPDCGLGSILLVESRGLEGLRWARCAACAGERPVSRLGCPSCGVAEAPRQRVLIVEGDESGPRLFQCGLCGFETIVTTTLARLSAPALLVMELAGLSLRFTRPSRASP